MYWTGLAQVMDKCQSRVAAVLNFRTSYNVDNYLFS